MTENGITLLFVPETAAGQGTGHTRRCISLAASCEAPAFLIPARDLERMLLAFPRLRDFMIHTEIPSPEALAAMFVVLDRPGLGVNFVKSFMPAFRLMALDATGPGASLVPVVTDLLPRLGNPSSKPGGARNLSLPGLLFPQATGPGKSVPGLPRSVAVSFGGEDPADLRLKLLESGLLQKHLPEARVDIINGPATRPLDMVLPPGWSQTGPFPALSGILPSYDLLITSFGLTALEARAAGLAQVHLNPSAYHQKLSLQEGFSSLGIHRPGRQAGKLLENLLSGFLLNDHAQDAVRAQVAPIEKANLDAPDAQDSVPAQDAVTPVDPPAVVETPAASSPEPQDAHGAPNDDTPCTSPAVAEKPAAGSRDSRDFAGLVRAIIQGSSHACPACASRGNRVLARFASRTFFSCSSCGMTYQSLLESQPVKYSESYFFDEYRLQYGKTYLEDFGHIKAMGSQRVGEISRLLPGSGHTLLDIGCAYGPFLAAAREGGFIPHGCDISQSAVEHVSTVLGMKAWSLDFRDPSVRFDPETFDVVTLWYVIEHFADLGPVFRSLASLVKPGGILALSTPSGEGISARARMETFLDRSPMDHYTIWNPSRVSRLLEPLGFRLESIRSTGHHPERFPGILGKPGARFLSMKASQAFRLGDTFEIYARRMSDRQGDAR